MAAELPVSDKPQRGHLDNNAGQHDKTLCTAICWNNGKLLLRREGLAPVSAAELRLFLDLSCRTLVMYRVCCTGSQHFLFVSLLYYLLYAPWRLFLFTYTRCCSRRAPQTLTPPAQSSEVSYCTAVLLVSPVLMYLLSSFRTGE